MRSLSCQLISNPRSHQKERTKENDATKQKITKLQRKGKEDEEDEGDEGDEGEEYQSSRK